MLLVIFPDSFKVPLCECSGNRCTLPYHADIIELSYLIITEFLSVLSLLAYPSKKIKRIIPYITLVKIQGSIYRRMWDSIVTALNVAAGYNPNAKKNRGEKPITGLTAHIFRHNFCTELCYQIPAISTKMIARLLGDDERMVLDVYSHILAEKENVAETLNKAFSKS